MAALQAAVELGKPLHAELAEGVAESQCLPKLQWLLTETDCPRAYILILNVASEGGDVATLRWLRTQGVVPDLVQFDSVSTMPVLQHYLEVDAIVDEEEACYDAAYYASLECCSGVTHRASLATPGQ